MKKLIYIIMTIVLSLSMVACSDKNKVKYDIENDIEIVKTIFSCVNKETLVNAYDEDIIVEDMALIDGKFAGIKGKFEVEFYGEEASEYGANNIYAIRFVWDYNQNVPMEEVASEMCNYLGEYEDNYNKEYDYYCWHGMDLTKFSNTPFANSFDIQIFGDDCYMVFGMYTIS